MATIKFTNAITSALVDVAIAGRTLDTANGAFDLKVAAFYTEIKGRVGDLPQSTNGAKQSPAWEAFRNRWIEAYLDEKELAEWKNASRARKNTLQNKAVVRLAYFRKALAALAEKGVKVGKNTTVEQVRADAAKASPRGTRTTVALHESVQTVLNEQIKRVNADLALGKEKRVLRGHAEIVAALTSAHDLLNPSK